MTPICIVGLVGLPAVGKTTFCKMLLEIETLPFNVLHICYDDFLTLDANKTTISYKEQREGLLNSLVTTIETLKKSKPLANSLINRESCCYKEHGSDRTLIICDDNHYYSSMRFKLFQMARKFGLSYGQIYFQSNNMDKILQENDLRPGKSKVPEEVFRRMSLCMEIPQLSLSWEKNTFIVQALNVDKGYIISDIIPFLTLLFGNTLKPLEKNIASKCVQEQSQAHNLDVLLRKRIGLFMKSNVSFQKKQVAQLLNDKRIDILKEFQNKLLFEDSLQEFDNYLMKVKNLQF